MPTYYYAPFQRKLRRRIFEHVLSKGRVKSPRGSRPGQIASPLEITLLAGAAFLAYTPFLQPSPPAKRPDDGILPIYNMGGRLVI